MERIPMRSEDLRIYIGVILMEGAGKWEQGF